MAKMQFLRRVNRCALGELRLRRRFFRMIQIALPVCVALICFGRLRGDTGFGELIGLLCSYLLVCFVAIAGFIAADSLFEDTYSTAASDIANSLPADGPTRYLSRLWALLLGHILPVTVWSGVLALLLPLCDLSPGSRDLDEPGGPELFVLLVGLVFLLDALTVLLRVCAGKPAGTAVVGEALFVTAVFFPVYFNARFDWTSTIGESVINAVNTVIEALSLSAVCAVSAVLFVIAGAIYVGREARSVGKLLASGAVAELLLCLLLMIVLSLGMFRRYAIVWTAVVAVAWMVIHMVWFRARRKGRTVLVRGCIFLGVMIATLLILHVGFRINRKQASPVETPESFPDNGEIYYRVEGGNHPEFFGVRTFEKETGEPVRFDREQLRRFFSVVQKVTEKRSDTTGFLSAAFGLREINRYNCTLYLGLRSFGYGKDAGAEYDTGISYVSDGVYAVHEREWFRVSVTEAQLEEITAKLGKAGFVMETGRVY